ncbi:HlyD family efflux transporter periplasmic adaptor subunit [Noviherbaspirillum cavernae]|uniref:HlyD family efflux transporter periplasmic adaptor subunit n=1 Tax=Noviherbaspirillum cavernae TaxID=2320862 RepID=A0A418X1V9_9BURK|nr:efflux RND transporter periplasmic adaptor subunit [Noviherbaspirillum cavernae]RJG06442.1 HlyD family efflux transporter periplasmic adaptor subunit [Noviherbaspirillum cavernae]
MATMTNAAANTHASAPTPIKSASGSPQRKKILLTIAALFILAGIAYGVYWTVVARFSEETENAYVQGNVIQVTPQVTGTVAKIHVDDTDVVKAGQRLISLDMADADVAVAQAEAQLAQTVREVRTLYASQAQAGANLALRETELVRAQDDLSRRKTLIGSGAVSGEEIRHAEIAVTAAKAAVAAATEQLASGRALTEGTTVARHPNVQRAAARLQEVILTQSRSTLYAPVGGEIAKRSVQVGQRINPGAPLMAIVPLDQVWVDANFKESQLRDMRIGQPVTLVSDLYGSKVEYHGKVIGLAAGTGSAFALLPAQNATGNWIKVVQRVPVRIALNPKQLAEHPLRVGLSMTARVDMHDQTGAPVGAGGSHAATLAAHSAAADENDAKAKMRIDAIIAANLK